MSCKILAEVGCVTDSHKIHCPAYLGGWFGTGEAISDWHVVDDPPSWPGWQRRRMIWWRWPPVSMRSRPILTPSTRSWTSSTTSSRSWRHSTAGVYWWTNHSSTTPDPWGSWRRVCQSASRTLVGFGGLNDTTIKELIILLSIWAGANYLLVKKWAENWDKRLIWQDVCCAINKSDDVESRVWWQLLILIS